MRSAKQAGCLVLILAGVLSLCTIPSFGTMEIAKKEKAACTTCHVKMGSKDLNAVGACYKRVKSLKKCEVKAAHKK